MPVVRSVIALVALGSAAPLIAADPGAQTVTVRVARPHAGTPAAARALERRIASAALRACGASPYSAAGVVDAVAHSPCWRESYAGGMAQARRAPSPAVASLGAPHATGEP